MKKDSRLVSIWSGLAHILTSLYQVLDAAFKNGCTFWDTANIYGDSEELIGKWCVYAQLETGDVLLILCISDSFLRFKKTGKRDQIFLATKFGVVRDKPTGVDGSAKNVEESFNHSLQRLGVSYVDLYYLHR